MKRLPVLLALVFGASAASAADRGKAAKAERPIPEENIVSTETLPAEVAGAIEERWPGADLDSAALVKKGFSIEVTTIKGEHFRVLVNSRGKIKSAEALVKELASEGGEDGEDEPSEEPDEGGEDEP